MPGEKISYDGMYVMCLSLVIALGSFNAGYQIGVMNSLADVFKVKNGYNVSQEKIDRWEDVIWPLVNTILTICAAISSFCGDFLAAPLGRTKMMHVTNAITVIAAGIIQVLAYSDQWSSAPHHWTRNIRNCHGLLSLPFPHVYHRSRARC